MKLGRALRALLESSSRHRGAGRSGPAVRRLNIGCGRAPLAGWTNIDVQDLPGVDRVLDVRQGIPYRDLEAVFAEHFLEHLTFREAIDFLRAVHGALAPTGALRLSTPNLAWVWTVHDVRIGSANEPESRLATAFEANRAFYGWQHRFLWTGALLEAALTACGFADVRFRAHGESDDPKLAGLEQHERYPDSPDLPHVLVLEARHGIFERARHQSFLALARRHFLDHLGD